MLYYGIPEFRLPREILRVELHNALRLGVELKTGVTVGSGPGETSLSGLLTGFDAVLLCTGCMAAVSLPLREDQENDPVLTTPDVEYGLDFLMGLHRGERKRVGRRVSVVGAGFTALDCARVARRLGAEEITIHLRTTEEYIPVPKDEIFETKREDIRIKGLRTPVALVAGERWSLAGVRFVQNRLGGWRESGRRHAIPIEGSEFVEPCDTLLVAIGQKSVTDYLDLQVDVDRWGNVSINKRGMTNVEGLFAAGDHVTGATTVIHAIGHGRKAALDLDTWLMGRVRRESVVRIEPVDGPVRKRAFDFIPRQDMPTAALTQRCRKLGLEVETGLDAERSLEEAKRCYLCNLKYEIDIDNCIYCRACIDVAPKDCIKLVEERRRDHEGGHLRRA
jgi:NADPH-dependent glutamate synthase beta subunit-like oxidoreductase/NAD-dependent dihydropyrimidine dehydrogenase PreA subunit